MKGVVVMAVLPFQNQTKFDFIFKMYSMFHNSKSPFKIGISGRTSNPKCNFGYLCQIHISYDFGVLERDMKMTWGHF